MKPEILQETFPSMASVPLVKMAAWLQSPSAFYVVYNSNGDWVDQSSAFRVVCIKAIDQQSNTLLNTGRASETVALLAPLMSRLNSDWRTDYYYGVGLAQMGKVADAVQYYEWASQLKPTTTKFFFLPYNEGVALSVLGRMGDAHGAFAQAASIDPTYPGLAGRMAEVRGSGN